MSLVSSWMYVCVQCLGWCEWDKDGSVMTHCPQVTTWLTLLTILSLYNMSIMGHQYNSNHLSWKKLKCVCWLYQLSRGANIDGDGEYKKFNECCFVQQGVSQWLLWLWRDDAKLFTIHTWLLTGSPSHTQIFTVLTHNCIHLHIS